MQETWVRSLGQENRLEKEMATYSSILAWGIPWTEELGGLQSMGSQRVGHNWATTHASLCKMIPWRRQWHQYSYLENPMDRGAWWAAVHRGTMSRTWLGDWAHTPGKISAHRALPVSASPFSICVRGCRDVLSFPLDYLWKCRQQLTQTKKCKFIITWSCQYLVVGHLDQNVIFPLLLN